MLNITFMLHPIQHRIYNIYIMFHPMSHPTEKHGLSPLTDDT